MRDRLNILATTAIFISIFFLPLAIHAEGTDDCKQRLPEVINNYQPAILPVISFDGRTLYFDRKWYPANTGKETDDDDIWFSELGNGNSWSAPEQLKELNSAGSDALFYISPDNSFAIVYQSDKSSPFAGGFAIAYRAQNGWTKPSFLNIANYYNNSPNFYCTMSPDYRVMIFSISRNDSIGGEDLFISGLMDNGSWSEPKNMGPVINTPYDENAPYIALDNKTLFFSSNRKNKSGKRDIYMSRRLDDSWMRWSEPYKLGAEINTPADESSICLTAMSDSAYIVSSDTSEKRQGIYKICLDEKYRPSPYLVIEGAVNSRIAGNSVRYAKEIKINLTDKDNNLIQSKYSNPYDGLYRFIVPSQSSLKIHCYEPGYAPVEISLDSIDTGQTSRRKADILLYKEVSYKNPFVSLFFDLNVAEIKKGDEDKLYSSLSQLKNIADASFEIAGYADEAGTDEYNFQLSAGRAENVAVLLKKLGIRPAKIRYAGKGISREKQNPSENRRVDINVFFRDNN